MYRVTGRLDICESLDPRNELRVDNDIRSICIRSARLLHGVFSLYTLDVYKSTADIGRMQTAWKRGPRLVKMRAPWVEVNECTQ
jgi:hypothetical protein